jgi:GNAT superfamily N-acetyltransferase
MSDLQIRDLKPEDYAVWRLLWDGYCAFYKVDLAEGITQRTWNMLVDPHSVVQGRVADLDDRLVGFAHHVVHPTTWTATNACYLEDLYVDPSARSTGLGRALIDDLLALCKTKGWSRLYWHTNADNDRARLLYDSYVPADPYVRYRIPLA